MKRYPDGWQGKSFFQKQAPSHIPDWIETAAFPASTREGEKKVIDYALVDDELALLWMVNMGCIDMHTWASRADRPERPDWVMFDLDPSEGATFEDVVEVALLVRETLDVLGLESVPKTSGSRGIHVLVPIARRHGFDEVREFAGIVAGALARAHPGLVTTEWTRAKRRGVLVDANQNGPGKTTASVYSVRPRAGAPVSTPLRWDEVVPGLDPNSFTMDIVLERVRRDGDLFAPVLEGGQSLGAALRARSLRPHRPGAPNSGRQGSSPTIATAKGQVHSSARARGRDASPARRAAPPDAFHLPVAEPRGHAGRLGGAALEPAGAGGARTEAAERELEHRDAHLRAEAASLAGGSEPGAGVDRAVDLEARCGERLRCRWARRRRGRGGSASSARPSTSRASARGRRRSPPRRKGSPLASVHGTANGISSGGWIPARRRGRAPRARPGRRAAARAAPSAAGGRRAERCPSRVEVPRMPQR